MNGTRAKSSISIYLFISSLRNGNALSVCCLCRTFLSGVLFVLNLRDDALPSAYSLLRSVHFLSVSWPPFLSVITFPKLSYKTFQIVL